MQESHVILDIQKLWVLAQELFTTGSLPLPQPVCCEPICVSVKVRAMVNSRTFFFSLKSVVLCPDRRYEGAKRTYPHSEKQARGGRGVGEKNVGQATKNGQCP